VRGERQRERERKKEEEEEEEEEETRRRKGQRTRYTLLGHAPSELLDTTSKNV
jgi:hypothetical protein